MQGTKNPRERGKFSSNTVRLTVCWAGDIVADSEKGRLNFLFAGLDVPEVGALYFNRVLQRDLAKWARVVKAKNLQPAN